MKFRVILLEFNRSFRNAKSSSGSIAALHQLAIELMAIETGRVSSRLVVDSPQFANARGASGSRCRVSASRAGAGIGSQTTPPLVWNPAIPDG